MNCECVMCRGNCFDFLETSLHIHASLPVQPSFKCLPHPTVTLLVYSRERLGVFSRGFFGCALGGTHRQETRRLTKIQIMKIPHPISSLEKNDPHPEFDGVLFRMYYLTATR